MGTTPRVKFDDWMSEYDAGLWEGERDPRLRSTVLSVWVLDRMPDQADFEAMMADAVEAIPRLRQRVVQDPLQIAPPRWEIDPNFDPSFHLRRLTLGGSGTLRDLLDMAEPIVMTAFDKDRPLWEFYLVDGLEGGRAGAIMKLHHAVSDGVGLVRMTENMVERDREASATTRAVNGKSLDDLIVPEPKGKADLVREAIGHRVESILARGQDAARGVVGILGDLVTSPRETVVRGRDMVGSIGRLLRPIDEPMSPVMRDRGMALALDGFTVPLVDLKAAGKSAGRTLNDAFVAAIAGGFRMYHEQHGASVDELQMMMPINMRGAGDEADRAGNQFAPARFLVPVGIVDPVERMNAIHERVSAQRAEPALPYIDEIVLVMNQMPRAAVDQLMAGMVTSIDFVTSNVPGPRRPVFTSGAKIEHMFPFGPPAGAGVNITLFSYCGECHIGVNADRKAVKDPARLVECLKQGFAEVMALRPSTDQRAA